MHLFKNKTKDVKQFLQEMKANKTNRSSNTNTLQKNPKSNSNSPAHQDSQFYSNQLSNPKSSFQTNRRLSNVSSNSQSNMALQASNVSVPRSIYPSNNQNFSYQPNVSQQRASQNKSFYREIVPKNIYQQQSSQLYGGQSYQFNHCSQPIYGQYPPYQNMSNYSPNYYNQQKSPIQLQNSGSQFKAHQNVTNYQNTQSSRNFNQFNDQRRNSQNYENSLSQNSNSTVYESAQLYQNSNFMPNSYQRQSQPYHKQQQSHLPTKNIMHKPQKSNSQFDTHSMKNNFKNSQFSHQRQGLFCSQINGQYEMAQISQAEDGFSSQRDTQSKFIPFSSNHEFQLKKTRQIQITSDEDIPRKTGEKRKKENDNRVSFKRQNRIEKATQIKVEPQNHMKKTQKKMFIKATDDQKHKIQKSLHQIDQVTMKLDEILKEASIIMGNIERSDERFKRTLSNEERMVMSFNYVEQNREKCQVQKMEIEQDYKDEFLQGFPTEKRFNTNLLKSNDMKMNQRQTQKKTRNYYEQIEI